MFKKFLVFILMTAVVLGSVFAQETNEAETPQMSQNRISVSAGWLELAYERVLSPDFSTLFSVSYNTWFLMDTLSIAGKARWYPGGGSFFLDLGVGYSYGYDLTKEAGEAIAEAFLAIMSLGLIYASPEFKHNSKVYNINHYLKHGLLISPGFGFNVDIGEPDHFFMPIAFGADIRVVPGQAPAVLTYFRIGFSYAF